MRVLILGGSGVLGRAVIPRLISDGHDVVATTRSASKSPLLQALGATPAIVDALDADAVDGLVRSARPDVIVHLLTDLHEGTSVSNARLRTVGTRNLVDAAHRHNIDRMIAESISWVYQPGTTPAVETDPLDLDAAEPRHTTIAGVQALESAIQELAHGVVLRFGQLYGPGTWYASDGRYAADARANRLPATETITSFIHVEDAARAIVSALSWTSGTWNIVDDEPAPGTMWAPVFAEAMSAPAPAFTGTGDIGRPVSNAAAHTSGLDLHYPSWRQGFMTL